MGNLVSVSISAEKMFTPCYDCIAGKANHIYNLGEDLEKLKVQLQKLNEIKNDVKTQAEIAESQQMKPLEQVQGWVKRVEDLEPRAEKLITNGNQEVAKGTLRGCCPKNCISSYKLGKEVATTLETVANLRRESNFDVVAKNSLSTLVNERSIVETVGLEPIFDKVWRYLNDDNVGIIGLFGMGGVGKTTLLTQINNSFLNKRHGFNLVIWVVVSKDLNLQKIQDDIGKRLGFNDEKWKSKNADEKEIDIYRVLRKRKFVLLLDDLWQRVDLAKLGIPIPNRSNGCKVVFTTRSQDVCGRMEAQKKIKVECLGSAEAWDLFQKKVGEEALKAHSDIPNLAKKVAEECAGLPLSLITIGRAMACKTTPQEWSHAIEVLSKSASEFTGMEEEVFPLLKFSYDNLVGDTVKSCFLYCTLFPEDFPIMKIELIDYWIGEGFLVRAQDQGYDIIGTLVRACLLEDKGDHVKMHDVIRDMALWIACKCGKAKDNFLVQAGAQLIRAPAVKTWKRVTRMSLMVNHIEKLTEAPSCPNLLTLFLSHNRFDTIVDSFFRFMPSLTVLDLSQNENVIQLPAGISKLVSLQYLNLSGTGIRHLPIALKIMAKLKYLNLDYTHNLSLIPHQLISSFSMLLILKMFQCGSFPEQVVEDSVLFAGNKALVEELKSLEQLNELHITLRSSDALAAFVTSDKFAGCTQALCLKDFINQQVLNISSLKGLDRLNVLHIADCGSLKDWAWEGERINNLHMSKTIRNTSFHKLGKVQITNCSKLKDLTWLVFAPNLTYLSVAGCNSMDEVIRVGSSSETRQSVQSLNPFEKLQELILQFLPCLTSIYWSALPFSHLTDIIVCQCPNLRKLPLNSSSAKDRIVSIQGEKDWWSRVEFKDEATRNVFLRCFNPLMEQERN